MRLPAFPHTATVITPVEVEDSRGNTFLTYDVPPATTRDFNAWLQQNSSNEMAEDGRTPVELTWTLITHAPGVAFTGKERVSCLGMTFEVFGVPEPCYTLRKYHHTEMRMKLING